jgi:predicted DNA-binding antitoxin AbrB/MazE fold protein
MTITVEAVYENGVLKPTQPLPFEEHQQLQVTIGDVIQSPPGRFHSTAGLLKWSGDADELERFAIDPAFDPQESA